jgi:hypothetical protein
MRATPPALPNDGKEALGETRTDAEFEAPHRVEPRSRYPLPARITRSTSRPKPSVMSSRRLLRRAAHHADPTRAGHRSQYCLT